MSYRVLLTATAERQLHRITDTRIREDIEKRLDWLCHDPLTVGKPLVGPLAGYFRITAGGDRYRVIYAVNRDEVVVTVVIVGIRKEGDRRDVYALARKLLAARLIE